MVLLGGRVCPLGQAKRGPAAGEGRGGGLQGQAMMCPWPWRLGLAGGIPGFGDCVQSLFPAGVLSWVLSLPWA